MEEDVNLASVYLVATVTYDEFITPSLTGKHDITGEGIIISVNPVLVQLADIVSEAIMNNENIFKYTVK